MKHYESVIIGHISEDNNIDHEDHAMTICGGEIVYHDLNTQEDAL